MRIRSFFKKLIFKFSNANRLLRGRPIKVKTHKGDFRLVIIDDLSRSDFEILKIRLSNLNRLFKGKPLKGYKNLLELNARDCTEFPFSYINDCINPPYKQLTATGLMIKKELLSKLKSNN